MFHEGPSERRSSVILTFVDSEKCQTKKSCLFDIRTDGVILEGTR